MGDNRSELKNDNLNQVIMSDCCIFEGKLVKVTSPGLNVSIVKVVANGKRTEAATKHLKSASLN